MRAYIFLCLALVVVAGPSNVSMIQEVVNSSVVDDVFLYVQDVSPPRPPNIQVDLTGILQSVSRFISDLAGWVQTSQAEDPDPSSSA